MLWITLIVIGFICFIILGFKGLEQENKLKSDTKNALSKVGEHPNNDKTFVTPDLDCKISLNSIDKKFVLNYVLSPKDIKEVTIPFEKLVQSEVVIDDETVISTNRGSQLAGVAVGGLVSGGVGAIIGGLSAKQNSKSKINSMRIKITVDDFKKPNHFINFLTSKSESGLAHKGLMKSDPKVKKAAEDIDYWQSVLELAIRKGSTKSQGDLV